MAERDLIDRFLLLSSKAGMRFSRNNSGIAFHKDGSVVSYGVFSPGGSDCIGFVPHVVRPVDVGSTLAIFAAVELKTGKQTLTEDQQRFLRIVDRAGGLAAWGRDEVDVMKKLRT